MVRKSLDFNSINRNIKRCCLQFTDTIGLHRVENADNTETAVSLHLYCPPFDQCSIFNQRTGKSQKANVTFWSKYGQKLINKDIPCIPEDN